MSPPKTKYPKTAHALHIEDALWNFARKKSIEKGSFHTNVGSASEYIRRMFKKAILQEMPYLKNTQKGIDFDEAY